MSLASVRAFFAEKAPDITVIESAQSSATVVLAAQAYGVEPARIAKTLSLRIGDRMVLIVTSGLADGQQEGEGAVRGKAEDARPRGSR
jgi:prolyl-tRNA editing enzyme YbaK/EbsC (Cys-tRNA(Pro) deacylase)